MSITSSKSDLFIFYVEQFLYIDLQFFIAFFALTFTWEVKRTFCDTIFINTNSIINLSIIGSHEIPLHENSSYIENKFIGN